ncbi:hypothetical protein T484DRAFT_1892581, partial [Baffinella frigidus]
LSLAALTSSALPPAASHPEGRSDAEAGRNNSWSHLHATLEAIHAAPAGGGDAPRWPVLSLHGARILGNTALSLDLGVALFVDPSGGAARVLAVDPAGVAGRQGQLRVGDRILSVDSSPLASLPPAEVEARLRCAPGGAVSLGLLPPSPEAGLEPLLQKQPASGPDGPASGGVGAIAVADRQAPGGVVDGQIVVVTRPAGEALPEASAGGSR